MRKARSPPAKARWKAVWEDNNSLFKKFYATADQIVEDLQSGLSKDIIYRKSRVSNGSWGYTGRKRVPHSSIKIIKLKIPINFTDDNRMKQRCSISDF